MFWFKFIGGVMITSCGALCGVYASMTLKKRVRFFEQYLSFLTQTKSAIGYTAMNIHDILSHPSGEFIQPILTAARESMQSDTPLDTAWSKAVWEHRRKMFLNAEDCELLTAFADGFGTSNVDGELQKLELHRQMTQDRLKVIQEECSQKQKMYRVVGMFVGVVVSVLII